jgi:4-hydroxybenzoate polyprenyltransferase
MENLDKNWQKLSEALQSEGHLDRGEILRDLRKESEQPLQKLKKGVQYKLWFSLAFIVMFIALIFFLKPMPVKIFMVIIAVSYAVVAWYINKGLQELKQGVDLSQPTKEAIQSTLDTVKQVLKHEMTFYVVTFPFSLTGGFLAGISAESGNLDTFIENPWVWAVLAACHLIFFPIGYWVSKKMNDRAFGRYIRQLEELISMTNKG